MKIKGPLIIMGWAALIGSSVASVYSDKPLHETSFKEILRSYTFVNDFSLKHPDRPVSQEIFWKYPIKTPPVQFDIYSDFDDEAKEFPATVGGGMAVLHMNKGRLLFKDGLYGRAKATWLSARARYGKEFEFHRRNDYFIGLSFINIAERLRKEAKLGWHDPTVTSHYSNATTFYSWAFVTKAGLKDPVMEQITPKGLYNLAAIYWRYGRFAGAYGAANKGLEFLRRTGRKEYRAPFNRIMAESFIKNRTFLEAIQHIDTAIRQDPDPLQAAALFTRVGDIYFGLNNYELAEDAYALGARIDYENSMINPEQMVLRGEALFWLGRFSEAQKVLRYALEGASVRNPTAELSREYASYASLRLADAFLARGLLDKARLAYFNVTHDYKRTEAARMAKVRSACLELPFYSGNNVRHARELLGEAKTDGKLPAVAHELAWACEVNSFTDRERTQNMLDRVKKFAVAHPESRFLKSMVKPVKEVQASRIQTLYKRGDTYKFLSFFEKNRPTLFDKVSSDLQTKLFTAYVDVHQSAKADEFAPQELSKSSSDIDKLRYVVFLTEQGATDATKSKRSRRWARTLEKSGLQLPASDQSRSFVQRLLAAKKGDVHTNWIYDLTKQWGGASPEDMCAYQYSLLSRIRQQKSRSVAFQRSEMAHLVAKHLPGLMRLDESCAVSLLDLEARLYKGEVVALAKIYQERKAWPLQGAFLKTYWSVSELLSQAGQKALARQLWQTIKENGPEGSPEVGFAAARLDPRKTEFEKLW